MGGRGSTTVYTLEFRVVSTGIPQVGSSLQSLNTNATQTTTGINNLNKAVQTTNPTLSTAGNSANNFSGALGNVKSGLSPVQGGLSSTNTLVGQNAVAFQNAGSGADKYTASTNKVTSSVLPLVGKVTGLSFAFTGLFASMGEAQGMQELLALSQDKVNVLQDQQTKLINAGQQGTKAYASVTSELEKAERALSFQQRVTNLSTQDQYFFIASIAGQLIPTAIKGYLDLSNKIKEFGGGLSGVADLMKTKVTTGFVSLAEKSGLLPQIFTSAGTSANTFGGALRALALNPVMLAITAITVALGLFINNTFGARDAINQFGVWLGNTIPILRPLLVLIGQVGDFIVTAFGGKVNQVIPKVQELTAETIKMREAFRGVLDIEIGGNTLQLVQELNAAISDLSDKGGQGIDNVKTKFAAFSAGVNKDIPGMNDLINEFNAIVKKAESGAISYSKAEELLNAIWGKTKDLVAGVADGNLKKAEAQAKGNESTKEANALSATQIDELAQVKLAIDEEMSAMGNSASITSENSKIVSEWINVMGLSKDITDEQIVGLLKNAQFMKFFGDEAVITKDKVFDLDASIQNYIKTQNSMQAEAGAIWEELKAKIDTVGMDALPEVLAKIEAYKAAYPPLGKTIETYYNLENDLMEESHKNLDDMIEQALKRADTEETVAAKIAEAKAEAIKKTREEAEALGILDKIQDMNVESQNNAIKIYKASQEEISAQTFELQKLAVARGLDIGKIEQSDENLRKYIKTHELERDMNEEVENTITIMIAKREEEARQEGINEQALIALAAAEGVNVDTMGLSADAIQQLIDNHDALHKVRQTALDDIALWQDGLKLEQAEEQTTTEELLKFGEGVGITVPSYITDKGIPAIKEYIESIQGIGPGAKKAKEEALKAFEELTSGANKALEGIISDKLGEDSDNIKKALKGIEKADIALDSLTAQEQIINIYLNDENFENDVLSLGDIMREEFNRLSDFSTTEATTIGDDFITNLNDQVGKKSPETVATVLAIWENIKANPLPQETGDMMLGRFGAAIGNPEVLKAFGKQGIEDPLTEVFGTTAAKAEPELVTPIIDAEGKLVTDSKPAVDPIEGVFSEAFLEASIVSTGHINQLLADITLSMTNLKGNIETTLGEITGLWGTHRDEVKTIVDEMDLGFKTFSDNIGVYSVAADDSFRTFTENTDSNQAYLADQVEQGIATTMSTFSKSMATWTKSMTTNVSNFVDDSIEKFEEFIDEIDQVIDAVDKLIDKMEDLEAAAKAAAKAQSKVSGGGGGGGGGESELEWHSTGGSFVLATPTKIANHMVAEAGPEIITVTPLKDISRARSSITLDTAMSTQGMAGGGPTQAANIMAAGGAGSAAGPIYVTVTGTHTTILRSQSGRILAQEVMPFLMSGNNSLS